jgi:hypothetical protein
VKILSLIAVVAAVLLCGCHISYQTKRGVGFELGFGVRPPTNAIVGVKYTKVGIIVDQSATTQTPTLTLGYQRGEYYRIPILSSNEYAPPFSSSVLTSQDGLHTTITEEVTTGSTNAPIR